MWNDLTQDARYAFRSVRQHAGFFITAVLIIGLGVGGSTAIFSVVNPMLLRSLPFEEPDRLVWIANTGTSGLSAMTSRTSNLRDYRRLNQSFEHDLKSLLELEASPQAIANNSDYHRDAAARFLDKQPTLFDWERQDG